MDYFQYKNNQLFAENVDINLLTQKVDTPFYLYSKATIERHWHAFNDSFPQHPHLICYAVKANSTLAILSLLAKLGSGFDIVSVGELERVLKAGGKASKIVFSGVGKKSHELKRALEVGIKCFNIESEEELIRLNQVAINLNVIAPVSIRVNPDVDAKTHPYIATGLKDNKFGIDIKKAFDQYIIADQLSHIKVVGIDCHIGSQLTQITPFLDALDRVLELNQKLSDVGIKIQHLDLGGGLGICYQDEQPPLPAEYGNAIMQKMTNIPMEIIIEPGRAIVGNAGILVTEVEYIKNAEDKNFAIVDAAMNDLMRPALYQSWQEIIPVNIRQDDTQESSYDVVGPICETGDFLGKKRTLKICSGDYLAVRSSGAYGFTMSSNYNSRPRGAEVMVDTDEYFIIRQPETIEQLMQGESVL